MAASPLHRLPADEAEVIHVTDTLVEQRFSIPHMAAQTVMWRNRGAYLGAEGDLSETLLYGNFLSVWTDQEDLRPAHLQQRKTPRAQ